MSLTRKSLAALGIEADKIDEIISGHSDTVNGLKDEIDGLNAKLKNFDKISKENETLKEKLEKYAGTEDIADKYEKLEKEYENYKKSISDKETLTAKQTAYKTLLKELGISEKRHESIIKLADMSNIELEEDGKIKDSKKLKETLKAEWEDFIETPGQQGVKTETPPNNNGGEGKQQSRAAILAAKYQQNMYGNKMEGN